MRPLRLPGPPSDLNLCRCGHVREVHLHYRPGQDCSACGTDGCTRFRKITRAGYDELVRKWTEI